MLGNFVGANPHLAPILGQPASTGFVGGASSPQPQLTPSQLTARLGPVSGRGFAGNLASYLLETQRPQTPQTGDPVDFLQNSFQGNSGIGQTVRGSTYVGPPVDYNSLSTPGSANSYYSRSGFAPQGFLQAGQSIAGQLTPNTSITLPNLTTPASQAYSPYRFTDPGADFTQRTPYQFQQTPSVNVADTYTPQYNLAQRDILEQGNRSREQLLSDLNRRGMLTTGAANREMMLNLQEQDRRLADLSSRFAIEQGRSQLQEDQMRRQMEMQRQVEQAAEIFRQQGATDEQARYLASQNVNLQNAQAGQNLSAFNTNLSGQQQRFGQDLARSQLLGQQQQQQFNQALEGRRQGTAEEQLANLMRRQPMEDMFRLWGQQAGPTGATPGDPGLMPIFGEMAGAGVGALMGLI